MPKYNFHVVLPNGDEYLTETLEEARALEARYGKSLHLPMRLPADGPPHGRPDPRTLKRNASQAPPSRKERMKPALTDGYKHPPQAWAREAIQNSFDAGATKIEFTCGENDVSAVDDGKGMSEDILLNKLMVPGMSEKPVWAVGGFGEAKKLLTFPWDHFIIVTKQRGGKTLVVIGSGEVWDYWRDGKCHEVKYARQKGGVPPHWTDISPSKPESEFLPYADAKPFIAKIEKQGHGTSLYIRGTNELHEYMQEAGLTRQLGGNKGLPCPPDIISYVVKCELPGKLIVVNGEQFAPNVAIPPTAKKFPEKSSYPGIELYLAPPASDDASGSTVIRAGGQLMWIETGIVPGTLFVQITGDTKRLLTNTRDSFTWSPGEWWEKFKTRLAKDVSSTFREEAFDEEFEGSGEAVGAERDASLQRAQSAAWDAQYEYERKAEQRPPDTKAEQRKMEQEKADKVSSAIQSVMKERATQQAPEQAIPAAVQDTPTELIKEMVEEASKEGAAAIASVVSLALWRPPLRLTNEISDWSPGPEWRPETMGEKQIRLLRAWTEAIRRIYAILGQYDEKFCVGFVFSEGTLAYAGWSKTVGGARSYCLNPFVDSGELRQEELLIPKSMVNLRPDSPDVIPLDATIPRHQAIITARAVHECVHGLYGISGHDEYFSSGLTLMIAQLGDKLPSVLAAAKKGASEPVPRITRGKGGEERTTLRAAPQRQAKEGGVDPRIPPIGTVLSREGLTVMVAHGSAREDASPRRIYILRSNRNAVPGSYAESLSGAVKAHHGGGNWNGFAWFDLTDSTRKSKWERDRLLGYEIDRVLQDPSYY